MLLELLTITWGRISSDVKREIDTEQKLLSLLREHNINSVDRHTATTTVNDADRSGLGSHLFTYSLTRLLTHALTHLPTHSRTHLLTHPLTHSLTHSLTHLLTHAQVIVMQVEKTAS